MPPPTVEAPISSRPFDAMYYVTERFAGYGFRPFRLRRIIVWSNGAGAVKKTVNECLALVPQLRWTIDLLR